ncbi:MAG: methionine adenosyltransferase [Nitrososphaerota archaeon]
MAEGKSFIHIEDLKRKPVAELEVEMVERKGKGHPDSLIDGACEAVSRSLCMYYRQKFDTILHHNVDKGVLVGGQSNPRFGGGEVVEPIYILVAGRATSYVVRGGGVEQVPVGGIVISAVKGYLKSALRFLDTERHVIVDYRIKPGSTDLVSVFKEKGKVPLSNDTSIGVGFAPFTSTERLTLETERLLNSERVKKELPELGEDIKVMALRKGREVDLTVAVATVCHLIPDASHYMSVMDEARRRVEDLASKITDFDVRVRVNAGDLYAKGSYYLTVTGTSAEAGDDGNTGRGNRPNGLITPMREYSMEATAGKNPVNHTGKIFNALAQRTAERIHKDVNGVKEVYVRLLSRIGAPIDRPQVASVGLILDKDVSASSVKADVEAIVNEELSRVTDLTNAILSGSIDLF